MSRDIESTYGHRVRPRVCGICIQNDSILLVKHSGLTASGYLWAPPGGGVQYGTSLEENLVREFLEETGLHVKILRFLFTYEHFHPPLQTIELFFEVCPVAGKLTKGSDPEMGDSQQIIDEVRFVSFKELSKFAPESVHYMLRNVSGSGDVLRKNGLFKFEKN